MVGRLRAIALFVVAVVALSIPAVPTAHAADVRVTSDVGALRAAGVVIRRVLPWVLAFVEELLEHMPPGTPPPPPPPVTPIGDRDYTP
jgi:hypothetical protein